MRRPRQPPGGGAAVPRVISLTREPERCPCAAATARPGIGRCRKVAPSSPDPRAPGVAHFRRHWFGRTETFLHTTITHLRRTRPLLVGCERANAAEFAVTAPVLELQPPGSLAARVQEWRARWTGADLYGRFDTRRTRRALARHGTRLLHAHFGYTGYHVLPLKRRSGLPLVTTFYGEDASRLPREPLWRERYAELFETGERFLVEGPCMRARLAELGCPPHKISIQHIAIPVARYPFRERAPRVAGERVRLFFCASLREKKGVLDALAATARARTEHPALELVLAGDGPLRGEVEAAVERLGLGAGVRRLGFVSHARMLEEMDAADLFIQPSVTARG